MRKHWRYLLYVLDHKRHVYRAGRRLGVGRWQLLVHDLSKFRPDEWGPYAQYFYGPRAQTRAQTPSEKAAFEYAFLLHLHRNPHHHQYWVLPAYGDKPAVVFPMPERYAREMVADWTGAGMAITGRNEVAEWYAQNRDRMTLDPLTRTWVERAVTP